MAEIWGAVTAGVIVAGATVYGASKQSKDNASAQAQNAELQTQQNNAAWQNWLMSKGVASPTPLTAGQMPSNGYAVNTRLPLWASVNAPTGTKVWRKAGTTPKINTLNTTLPQGASTTDDGGTGATSTTGGGGSGSRLASIVDPLNVSGSNSRGIVKSILDPIGLFG